MNAGMKKMATWADEIPMVSMRTKAWGSKLQPAARPPAKGLPRDLAPLPEDITKTQQFSGRAAAADMSHTMPLRSGGKQSMRSGVMRLGKVDPPGSVEQQLLKAQQLLQELWEEMDIPLGDRQAFMEQALMDTSIEAVRQMHDEIQRLNDRKTSAAAVEKAIEVREGCLFLVQEFVDRLPRGTRLDTDSLEALESLLNSLRLASLDVVDSILYWRSCSLDFTATYEWKDSSYLLKMREDLAFLNAGKLRKVLKSALSSPFLFPISFSTGISANNSSEGNGTVPLVDVSAGRGPLWDCLGPPQKAAFPSADPFADRVAYCERILKDEWRRLGKMPNSSTASGEAPALTQEHSEGYIEKSAAALTVQLAWRSYLARRHVSNIRHKLAAATLIQKYVRRHQAYTMVKEMKDQCRAAIRIQAWVRSLLVRFHVAASLRKPSDPPPAPNILQGLQSSASQDLRGSHTSTQLVEAESGATQTQAPEDLPKKRQPEEVVIKLQAWLRAKHAQYMYKCHRQEKASASKIQAIWKGFRVRQMRKMGRLGPGWDQVPERPPKALLKAKDTPLPSPPSDVVADDPPMFIPAAYLSSAKANLVKHAISTTVLAKLSRPSSAAKPASIGQPSSTTKLVSSCQPGPGLRERRQRDISKGVDPLRAIFMARQTKTKDAAAQPREPPEGKAAQVSKGGLPQLQGCDSGRESATSTTKMQGSGSQLPTGPLLEIGLLEMAEGSVTLHNLQLLQATAKEGALVNKPSLS